MVIRLLLAAVITLVGFMGGPTDYFESESITQTTDETGARSGALDAVYFEKTGQYLKGELLKFWAEFGGVQVFGFPVSGEVEQDGRIVQYFERAVLEIHPENSPEWRVLLRRLGDDAAGPSYRRNGAFQPRNSSSDQAYFEQTSQNLSPLFEDHWEAYGGIQVFGYPISSEFSANGVTIQYFERAVLEYHADNPEDWRILQPLLGLEAAIADRIDIDPLPHDGKTEVYRPNLFGRGGAGFDHVVYLTFDDGPHLKWTPEVLDLLEAYDARGTFFVLGQYARMYPDLIRRMDRGGHTIANHGYDHSSMAGMPWSEFMWQLRESERVVGQLMAPCMRPPYGAMDSRTEIWSEALGYELTLWDIDPLDWQRPGADIIAERILSSVRPGAVILLHDGGGDRAQSVLALEMVLEELTDRGYRFEAMCQ